MKAVRKTAESRYAYLIHELIQSGDKGAPLAAAPAGDTPPPADRNKKPFQQLKRNKTVIDQKPTFMIAAIILRLKNNWEAICSHVV